MRILGVGILSSYMKQNPSARGHLLAIRAMVTSEHWRRLEDVIPHFSRVAAIEPPDRITFNFEDVDLCVEMRVNIPLGLARVLSVRPSKTNTRRPS